MMNKSIILFLIFLSFTAFSQTKKKEILEIKKFQNALNTEYLNKEETPLRGDNFSNFKSHPFFPIDLKYRVTADFRRSKDAVAFDLPTSSGKTKRYIEYGKATFKIEGKTFTLSIYQSLDLIKRPGFEDYLFLPFRDKTNTKETYGGGKYLDLRIPKSGKITIDFNQSYQPYCAYNAYDYNCPIVPESNLLPIEIKAGVMYDDIYHH